MISDRKLEHLLICENYDVDAINFDDYFYADGIDDATTYRDYNPNNLSLADWRREQINLFIIVKNTRKVSKFIVNFK